MTANPGSAAPNPSPLTELRELHEKAKLGFPMRYQEESDAYTHIVRDSGDQHICQLKQHTNGIEEARARFIVAALNYVHDALAAQPAAPSDWNGEELRKLCYVKCGLDPAWMRDRWDALAKAIAERLVTQPAAPSEALREQARKLAANWRKRDEQAFTEGEAINAKLLAGGTITFNASSGMMRHRTDCADELDALLATPPATGQGAPPQRRKANIPYSCGHDDCPCVVGGPRLHQSSRALDPAPSASAGQGPGLREALAEDWPECKEFYELMQIYRHSNFLEPYKVKAAYEAVKEWLRRAALAAHPEAPAEYGRSKSMDKRLEAMGKPKPGAIPSAQREQVIEECAKAAEKLPHPLVGLIDDPRWREGYAGGRQDAANCVRALSAKEPQK